MKNKLTLDKLYPFILVIGGFIGLIASFVLSMDKITLLKNPDFQPLCSISPVLSCVSVMETPQAEVFGFPNMLMGLIGFSAVIVVGMSMFAGAQFKRWYWRCFFAGTVFGAVFVHWLFYQSVYNIQALCIYCMVVWTVTIPIFWYTLLYLLRKKHLPTPPKLTKVVAFVQKHHLDILLVWYIVIAILILQHFWYYFGTFI